jgi:protein-disulfide isomerase
MEQKTNYIIPLAIIIAGALIAWGVYASKKNTAAPQNPDVAEISGHLENNLPAVTADDHILGNPNAPVVMVEYSDTDCPFCQEFHPRLQQVINEYGKDGKVAWVYRHFAFHPNAPKEAEASECVAELGGNIKFFQYLDMLYKKKDFNQNPYIGLDPSQLPVLAASLGINKDAFNQCLSSGKYKEKVAKQYDDAVKAGAQGTPYTVLVTKNGRVPILQAISYEQLKLAISALLNEQPK